MFQVEFPSNINLRQFWGEECDNQLGLETSPEQNDRAQHEHEVMKIDQE